MIGGEREAGASLPRLVLHCYISLLLPFARAVPLTDATIRDAVDTLNEDGSHPSYGHISAWDVSQVTNMDGFSTYQLIL